MTNSQSVQETVFSSLREDIVTMRILPGTGVSVYEVSQRLSVSRTPVREAFIRLAAESLVEILPQRKTLVTRIDLERVRQERFLREALELSAIEPFLKNATPERVKRMKGILIRHGRMMLDGRYIEAMELDDEFHREIFLGAGQLLSWRAVDKTNGHYRRMRLMMIRENGEAEGIADDHEAIIAAIELLNAREAIARDREHLEKIACREETLKEKYPQYFA